MDPKSEKVEAKSADDQSGPAFGVDSVARATEKTLHAWFGIVRDVRGEVSQRILGAIDWLEGVEQGSIRLARTVVQRTDEVATAWIGANEQFALGVVRALRTTTEGVPLFASRTAASLTRARPREAVAQA